MLSLAKISAVAVLVAPTLAHFTLDYPQSRGFDEDLEPQFCGGFPLVNRTLFPLSGGMIDIDSHHAQSTYVTLISFDQNPTNFSEFTTSPSGQTYGYLKNYIELQGTGEMCIPVNISALGVPGVGEGTNATILVQFNGGDGTLYQCADVTLTNNALQSPSCTNSSTFVAISSSNETATSTSSTASGSSPSTTPSTKSSAQGSTFVEQAGPAVALSGLLALVTLVL